jgi:hypothetical protein
VLCVTPSNGNYVWKMGDTFNKILHLQVIPVNTMDDIVDGLSPHCFSTLHQQLLLFAGFH